MWLSSACNAARLTKQQFQFYLLLINLHLNSCLWPVTTTLDRTGLSKRAGNEKNTGKKDTERDKYKLPTSKLFLSTTVSLTDGCLGPLALPVHPAVHPALTRPC